ncbi:hypothetical protein, conserved [Eimeria brunetti]|uniref:Transmembrane protein n=1 Tax=Eimeria brunetti TaxID=51314 RepID=U6LZT4_9EIME|nr:hypothetical protein, conserved [Eimeria brunetti]
MHESALEASVRVPETPIVAARATGDHLFIKNARVNPYTTSMPSVGYRGRNSRVLALAAILLLLPFILAVSSCLLPKKGASTPAVVQRRLASSDGGGKTTGGGDETYRLCEELLAAWSPAEPDSRQVPPASFALSQDSEGSRRKRSRSSSAEHEESEGGVKWPLQETLLVAARGSFEQQPVASTSYYVPSPQESQENPWLAGSEDNSYSFDESAFTLETIIPASPSSREAYDDPARWIDMLVENYGGELESLHRSASHPPRLNTPPLRNPVPMIDLSETVEPAARRFPQYLASNAVHWPNRGQGSLPAVSQGWPTAAIAAPEPLPSSSPQGSPMRHLTRPAQTAQSNRKVPESLQISGIQTWPRDAQGAPQVDLSLIRMGLLVLLPRLAT